MILRSATLSNEPKERCIRITFLIDFLVKHIQITHGISKEYTPSLLFYKNYFYFTKDYDTHKRQYSLYTHQVVSACIHSPPPHQLDQLERLEFFGFCLFRSTSRSCVGSTSICCMFKLCDNLLATSASDIPSCSVTTSILASRFALPRSCDFRFNCCDTARATSSSNCSSAFSSEAFFFQFQHCLPHLHAHFAALAKSNSRPVWATVPLHYLHCRRCHGLC